MNTQKLNRALKFIDPWLKFKYKTEGIPGFAVAIAYKGKIVFNNTYGFANLEKKEKLTKNHLFRIASHSKIFTATAIMQLDERKKLNLDDKIIAHLPWLKNHKDKRFKSITIASLLSHSGGLIRDGLKADFWQLKEPFLTESGLKKTVLEADLVFDTNTQMKYSNLGYSLLGMIIDKVSGKSYKDFIIENIIQPLKLSNTNPDITNDIKEKLITGYTRQDSRKKRKPLENVTTNAMAPATGFYSKAEDLCKFFSKHMIGSNQLLTDISKNKMQKSLWKIKNDYDYRKYGLGFIITPVGKTNLFGHTGGFPGQTSVSLCDPKNEVVIVVLTNCIDDLPHYMAKGILFIINYFDKNYSFKENWSLDKFEAKLTSLWGVINVVSMGNKLITVNPEFWMPFMNPEELQHINTTTLKVTKTDGFSNEGEFVHYNFDKNNKIISVNYTGSTMLPEK
jgi:D-alanyl-D-alanine carboxypeptidase